MDSIWRWGLAEFRDRTASDAPTPGGGSAAMVAAVTGTALVLMALRITRRKTERTAPLDDLIELGERLMRDLGRHADADIEVFEGYMDALKLPRATGDEKEDRLRALADAAIAATEVPLNAAQSVVEAIELADRAAQASDRHVVSDVGAGVAILAGALTAVLYNVDINLKSIKDTELAADYAKSRKRLHEIGTARADAVARLVSARLD